MQLLDELPLTPNAVEHLQHARAQQFLRRDRGPARRRVQPLELRRQPPQRVVHHRAQGPQRMIGGEPLPPPTRS